MGNFVLTSQISVRHFLRKLFVCLADVSQFFHRTSKCACLKRNRWLNLDYLFIRLLPITMGTAGAGEIKMAASPGAEEDSVYDTGRLSLFDLILERTRALNKVQLLLLFLFRPILLKNVFFFFLFCRKIWFNLTVSLIYFQKQLVHRLVYVSKIRQDVNDRKEIGGNYFTLQFSLHTTEYRSEYQIFVSLLSAFKLKLKGSSSV